MKMKNLDNSDAIFPLDDDIEFIPEGHKYIYKGIESFTSVSSLYMSFFAPFDAEGMAMRKSASLGKSPEHIMEEWEVCGTKASETGTFMHKQIENYFNGIEMTDRFTFDFEGKYISQHEEIDLSRELRYFMSFRSRLTSVPFRTEWCVCDPVHKVAGTIDFICRNDDGTFDMFDWKHSHKIDPNGRIYSFGKNGLSHIPDTSYWHYVLQQNAYRYILENYYGIRIRNMHLVILHPKYPDYIVAIVPRKDKEVEVMMNSMNS